MDKSMIKGVAIGGLAMVLVGAGAVSAFKTLDKPQQATVVSVKEITETVVTPQERCSDVQVTHRAPVQDEKRIAGTIVGGLAGGLIGNQIGGGTGKTLATIAGAAGGGYAGNQVQKNLQQRDVTTTTERRCKTVDEKSQHVVGYNVTYRLDGKELTTRMASRPGPTLQVKNGEVIAASTAAPR
ncbi:MAG: glycine zipper 2TM domain-containing protein [Rubrivivax sp.]